MRIRFPLSLAPLRLCAFALKSRCINTVKLADRVLLTMWECKLLVPVRKGKSGLGRLEMFFPFFPDPFSSQISQYRRPASTHRRIGSGYPAE